SGERDEAFEALEQNRPRLVPDIRVQKAQGRSQRGIDRGYLTYIAVPIVVGEDRFGMLTLDAPEANSFTDTDLRLSQFVAELLGIAFACAKYD
ncbi:MAG TPA: GAF domain-containing protein, partial [Propionibacteriaceae bacterium]|nr:GAF domain-containing protein [Propionibacteriaceae bacterium]